MRATAKNGRSMMGGTCEACGAKKTSLLSTDGTRGGK